MSRLFAELDRQTTPMGTVTLRRRLDPILQADVYEVKLDDEHLMSSIFTVGETALATFALAALPAEAVGLDVIVGGLGLGYTAAAALADARVGRLAVVEALDAVIDWHERGLVPNAEALCGDDRCTLVNGDFFAGIAGDAELWPDGPDTVDAILVDIDHTPTHHLADAHAGFYSVPGLERLAARLRPGGVFGLWSDRGVDDAFLERLRRVFPAAEAHEASFPNHHTGDLAADTIYVAPYLTQ